MNMCKIYLASSFSNTPIALFYRKKLRGVTSRREVQFEKGVYFYEKCPPMLFHTICKISGLAKNHPCHYMCHPLHLISPYARASQKAIEDSYESLQDLAPGSTRISSCCQIVLLRIESKQKSNFIKFIQLSVWGNRCDLSISAGENVAQRDDLVTSLNRLRSNLIANHSNELWKLLSALPEDQRDIVFILDNAGFELVIDFCLAAFLIESGLATSITFHVKTRPWFVSDTLKEDFLWTVDTLRNMESEVGQLGAMWETYLTEGRWKVIENRFWTSSYDFASMSDIDCGLYTELSKASLLIFKGDLNYRKLVGDLDWPCETDFQRSLRGFTPAPLVALRTAKGGPVVGLGRGVEQQTATQAADWNTSGEYGMIQLCFFC
ncbi:unnamed protein product, partial [Meganyctiphanes norvegica]